MKPRIRQLSSLYFRYGESLDLSAEQVANVLESEGLIKRIGIDSYRESEAAKVPLEEYEANIFKILIRFKTREF